MKIREKVMTRTVTTLSVKVMGINSDDITEIRNIEIPEIDEKKVLPYLQENSDDSFIPAKVLSIETVERLYAMPESVFLKYAKEIPARNIKEKEV